ncbi:MAG: membrane protein [Alphaproteobacteria bacterium]|nr:MAG: membrane protein [Alphaproteobacteria bacterium]
MNWRIVFALTLKELMSLARDRFLIGFVIYAFTVSVYVQATGNTQDIRNATIVIADEDRSALSRRMQDMLPTRHFRPPRLVEASEIDALMETGEATFALHIPPRFEADVLAGRRPDVQLLVDATAISQAGLGAAHIAASLEQEMTDFLRGRIPAVSSSPPLQLRTAFNQGLVSTWFTGVAELLDVTTMLAILLAGAAIVREREHGTLEHLLAMPVRPPEIMAAKTIANGLVILVLSFLSLRLVVEGLLGLETQGSVGLFLAGVAAYLFFAGSLGVFLGTVSRSMPQLALLFILLALPMILLSGNTTPLEGMPDWLQRVMQLSPSTHYVALAHGVLIRGADLSVVWPHFAWTLAIGSLFFAFSLLRFRRFLAAQQ